MWRYVSASVMGTSHGAQQKPCQDAHKIGCCQVGDEQVFWALVADGAGSAACAEEGSRLLCDSIDERILSWFHAQKGAVLPKRGHILLWLKRIRKKLSKIAEKEGYTLRDYASTLCGIIATANESVCFQIGDGSIVLGNGEGGFEVVFWPENGEYVNTTFFVTDANFEESLAFTQHAYSPLEIAIFSDGLQRLALHFASRTVHAPFLQPMFQRLALEAPGCAPILEAELVTFLNAPQVNQRTDDDKTLVLATQRSLSGQGQQGIAI